MKRALALILILAMLCGIMHLSVFATESVDTTKVADVAALAVSEHDVNTDRLYNAIVVNKGQLDSNNDGSIVNSDIYGYVVNYPLKKGHTLSISDINYVFSVRKWENGNYSTMLKQATTAEYTATEDMTVAMLIRKPDKAAVTAEELASIVIYDSQFGMIGVEGSVKRFTVEAETINGGTSTTRAAIFLPEGYSDSGEPTRLIVMTNGHSAHLTNSVWNKNSAENVQVIRNYLNADYAVWVVDNTAASTSQTPDLGCPQLVDSYFKAYEYIQNNLNVEQKFSVHARSFGTFAAVRIMREHPELVKCAVMTGSRVSIKAEWPGIKKAHVAKRFGFTDTTGATYEADKLVGYDPYTDVNDTTYALPPTFWMLANGDSTAKPCEFIEKLTACGNDVTLKIYSDISHTGICTLNTGETFADALSYLEKHQAEAHTHTYEKGICTVCGVKHPNLDNYKGKVISILSASTSTFAGYIPVADGFNLEHRARYPQDNLLTDVNETWWMQLINELDAKLGINDSWAGSTVSNFRDTNSGDLGPDAAMASLTRIQNLGANGTPDVILFFGAGNDMGRGVTIGNFDPATAPTEVELSAKKWDSFADAYVAAIMRLQHFYPDAEIIAMTTYAMPSYVTEAKLNQYGPVIKAICDHYGVKYVDLLDSGVTFDMLPDNIHPNAEGMDYITADVLDTLLNDVELDAGENAVYAVTHNLTNVSASRHYYKAVSKGVSFEETLSGENMSVTVTMDGENVTDSVFSNGIISIPVVTGELVITAIGHFDADGHLQQLPEKYCAGTNLWKALTPENIYYTTSGWGNTAVGTTWSITFPVKAGDRVWATSIGAYPENGSSANGVRVTWFDENGVLVSMSREAVYAEFVKYGYITAPEGAVALNLPMTNNQEHYAVYVLSADHCYENGICTVCSKVQPGPVITTQPQDVSVDRFAEATVSIAAEGDDLRYQWYYRCVGEAAFRVSACDSNTFRTVMSGDLHGCEVYCVVTDSSGNTAASDTVTLTLTEDPAPEEPAVRIPGDLNGDGLVNNKDLIRLFRYLTGWDITLE